MVYTPEEDSFLLADEIRKYVNILSKEEKRELKLLDMGSGTGILAETSINSGIKRENVLAVDIDGEAIKILRKKRLKALKSNLFSKINKKDKFDLIIFNAPYLPEDKDEPEDSRLATTAGKRGNETILKFLKQAKNFISKEGRIFLLFSSLSKPKTILAQAKKLGYNSNMLAEKSLFFEKLFVYELWAFN
jgi:HemK-related putative methylase